MDREAQTPFAFEVGDPPFKAANTGLPSRIDRLGGWAGPQDAAPGKLYAIESNPP